jgi:Protein of unknown function (DUF3102)
MKSIGNETAIVKTDYSTDHMLAEYAAEIRRRGKRIKEDVVEIGRLLDFSRQRIGRGDWLKWLKVEFSWSDQTAYNFICFDRDCGFKHALDTDRFDEFEQVGIGDLPRDGRWQHGAERNRST